MTRLVHDKVELFNIDWSNLWYGLVFL